MPNIKGGIEMLKAKDASIKLIESEYTDYFKVNPPGRTTVEVKSLPAGAIVEITAFALANFS